MTNIKYIVRLNDKKINEDRSGYLFYKTTCSEVFCGYLVNQNDSNFYFEVEPDNKLVIIPYSWIKWMAPSKDIYKKVKMYTKGVDNGSNNNC